MPENTQPPAVRPGGAVTRVKRDQQLRRFSRRVQKLAPALDDPKFALVVRSFSRVSLLVERAYATMRDQSLIGEDGELRPSVDMIRRLSETQVKIAKELGLTPSTTRTLNRARPIDLAGAFAHVEDADTGDDGNGTE